MKRVSVAVIVYIPEKEFSMRGSDDTVAFNCSNM